MEEALCAERDAAAAGKSADHLRVSLDTLSAEVGAWRIRFPSPR